MSGVKVKGFPLPGMPRSFSAAPAPRPTESYLARIERVARDRSFGSDEALNAFISSPEGQQAIENAPPQGRWEEAQDVAYAAWEADGPRRYELARRALAIDDRLSDAWLILAEEERTWRKQRRCFERAVAAAERAFQEEGWQVALEEDGPGSLYQYIPGRSYLRAHVALARSELRGGRFAEARVLYEKVLRLDPEDHMGVRYELLRVYHELGDREALRAILDRFPDDMFAAFKYERLWLALVEGADGAEVERLAREAAKANPHVLPYFLGQAKPPKDLPDYIALGGEEEAASYAMMAARWWFGEPSAVAWLKTQLERE